MPGNPATISSVSHSVRVAAGVHLSARRSFQTSSRRGLEMSKRFFLAGSIVAAIGILAVGLAGAGLRTTTATADKPNAWGFETANLDRTCKPCDDFYQFAMGGWMKSNPIPPEYSSWGSFTQLADKNQQNLRQILEAAAGIKAAPGSNEQKIGDFYTSCMDAASIDAAGTKPIEPDLARIAAIKTVADLQAVTEYLHSQGIGAFFRFNSTQDAKDSTQVIGAAFQGGLGLPEREYYLKEDDKSKQLRGAYEKHVRKMLELLGDPADPSAAEAASILKIETALATASMKNTDLRDPDKTYHKMMLADLQALTPNFSWEAHVKAAGHPELKEIKPRWKRCVQATDRGLGEALGQVYVQKYFPPEAKARALEMVHNLVAALRDDLQTLPWMGPETRKQATAKLEALALKIGYTDKWRDYSALKIERSSYAENQLRGAEFDFTRRLNKIGKPVERTEWGMTPPTVNAYNNSSMNEIVFPAGIMQPPFYDPNADDAVNYGGMGAVIGHEITHGFDDHGSKFDGQGNLKDWWSPEDLKNFKARAACVSDQFDAYVVDGDLRENGKLVLGESIADLGGLTIAYAAYEKSVAGKPRPPDRDGFTPEQRFFLGWTQVWGANERIEYARLMANTNPHPLPRFRGNGPLSNMAEFAKAFGCKKGESMMREQACKIW